MTLLHDSQKYAVKKRPNTFQQSSLPDYQEENALEPPEQAGFQERTTIEEPSSAGQQGEDVDVPVSVSVQDAALADQQDEDALDAREIVYVDGRSVIRLLSSSARSSKLNEPELGPLPPVELDTVLDCLRENERGDAQLFTHLFAQRCLHDASIPGATRGWYLWRGHFWEECEENYVRLLVSGPLARVYQKASECVIERSAQEQQQKADLAQLKEQERQSKQLAQRAEHLRALRRTDNVLGYAHTMLSGQVNRWDAHPLLLGTRQGVIDLHTGTLRAGLPDDRLRTIIPTEWKGLDEPAPRFQQFLREIFDDRPEAEREELIAFLQRALGYGITGLVDEHIFLMLYGEEGRNGKDTLMHVLEHVLGKAVGAVSSDVLISSGRNFSPGAARPHLCSLQGKRIAWVSESSREARFAIEQIKLLTGGSAIVTRQLYGKEYTFMPSHLLILLTNSRPEADAADNAFWDRLCPLVFNVRFVENPQRDNERLRDPALSAALKAEASGILAWLVRGTLEWQRLGLALPECVRRARQEYRGSESTVRDFVQVCCVLEPTARITASLLYKSYKSWARENGVTPVNNKQFLRELKQIAGVDRQRERQGNIYRGIRLQNQDEMTE